MQISWAKSNLIPRLLSYLNLRLIGPAVRFIFVHLKFSQKFRVLSTNSSAIGHLCADVDCFLKERAIGNLQFRGILLASSFSVSNGVISTLWAQNPGLLVIKNTVVCFLMDFLRTYSDSNYDCSRYCSLDGVPAEVYSINEKYNSLEPLIFWEPNLLLNAESLFKRLFPSLDIQRTVVLHSRDSAFDKKNANHNLFSQSYRNSELKSLSCILEFLNQRGFSVIRIGEYETDDSINKLQYFEVLGLNRFETDLINAYVTSKCALFLGSASGASQLAAIWNRPTFLVNVLPYAFLRPHSAPGMAIPKLLYSNGRVINACEIFKNNYHWYRYDRLYEMKNLVIEANDPEDCLDDFIEFFYAFVEGDKTLYEELKKSEQQVRYKEICASDSYDYKAISLIPRRFFKRYGIV